MDLFNESMRDLHVFISTDVLKNDPRPFFIPFQFFFYSDEGYFRQNYFLQVFKKYRAPALSVMCVLSVRLLVFVPACL